MSVLAPVSLKEEHLRANMLAKFREYDYNGNNMIRSEDFQKVLSGVGLSFGHPVVDRLMLLCHINPDGSVNLSRFAEVVDLGAGNIEKDARGFAKPKLHSDLSALSQADRVRRLAKDIHILFYKFDSGSGSLAEFRQNLAELGIRETHECKRLLRQTPISFRELLHSLMQTTNEIPANVAAGVARTISARDAMKGSEDPCHQRVRLNNEFVPTKDDLQAQVTREKCSKDSNVITWASADGVVDPPKAPSKGKSRGEYSHRNASTIRNPSLWTPGGESVADTIRNTNQHHFDTTYELAAAEGLQRTGGPLTSAGYNTRDNGLVREQIYSSIRQLDQGSLTSKDFRLRLQQLGMELPQAAKTLLAHYESNGRVDFKDFVRAFEPYFRRSTIHSPVKENHGHVDGHNHVTGLDGRIGSVSLGPRGANGELLRNAGYNKSALGHGDIIAWDPEKYSKHPQEENARLKTEAFKRRQKFYAESGGSSILAWTGPENAAPAARRKRGSGKPPAAQSNKDNIITWVGAAPAKVQKPSKLTSVYGMRVHNKPCPYGTDNDILAPGERGQVIGSRGQKLAPQSTQGSGRWFNTRRPDQRSLLGPNGSADGDSAAALGYKPALKRMTGMKSQEDHIGVGFNVKDSEPFTSGRKRRDMYDDHFETSGGFTASQAAPERRGKRIGYSAQAKNWNRDQVHIGSEN